MAVLVQKTFSTTCNGELHQAIQDNVTIVTNLEQIVYAGGATTDFWFANALSAPEDTELDNILGSWSCSPAVVETGDGILDDSNGPSTDILWSSQKITDDFAANTITITGGGILSGGGDLTANRVISLAHADVDHDQTTNTHNLTTDIDHNTITNTHNLTTDIDHDQLTNYVAIEHADWTADQGANNINDANIVASSVTQHEGSINHNNLLNTHNLTTDIDHDLLTNYVAIEHADWTADQGANNINDANILASSVTQHEGSIDHDNLLNFVANEHATPKNSIEIDTAQLQLVGDAATPGNTKLYGTNGAGVKGWYDQPAGASGEINTASNLGAGVGVFDGKVGVDLQFRSLVSQNNLLSITLDGVNDEIDFTVNEGNIDHDNLLNYAANEHASPKNSLEINLGQLQLLNDQTSPGNSKIYGTNATGTKGWYDQPTGGGGSVQLKWKFDSSTSASDPGSGEFRLNNSNPALATALYVNEEDEEGVDATTLLNALEADDRIFIQEQEDASRFILVDVVTVTDNGSWFTITFTVDDSGTLFTDGKEAGWVLVYSAGISSVDWGDITGTLSNQTDLQTALDAKADESITITAGAGLTGGGDLSANRTLSVNVQNSIEISTDTLQLAGDTAAPGNNKVYGTNGSGTRGWYDAATGTGDVSAAANLTDNTIIRGDGGAKGVQDSNWTIADDDKMSITSSAGPGTSILTIRNNNANTNPSDPNHGMIFLLNQSGNNIFEMGKNPGSGDGMFTVWDDTGVNPFFVADGGYVKVGMTSNYLDSNYDLLVDDGTIGISNASGNTVGIKASASAFTDYTLTLPLNDGDADDVLVTDGSGVLSWAAIEQGGYDETVTAWTLDSGDLYYADVNHALGTQCIAVWITDTTNDYWVRPEEIEVLNDNNIRVYVRGNTHSLKVCVVTGRGPRGPQGPQGPAGGGANQLSDLTDVNTSTPTNRNVLVADGVDFESRALVEADISDFGSYAEQLSDLSDVNTSTPTNRNVLVADGIDWESRALVEADISDFGSYAAASHTHVEADITDLGAYIENVSEDSTPTLGGDLEVNQKNFEFDPALTTNLTSSGFIVTATVDTNATGFGAALYMAADGNFDETDADAAATMPCRALALETGTGSKKILLQGFIRNDSWNWTVGGDLYISTTTGALTQTAPTGSGDQVQKVGFAWTADIVYFNPGDYTIVEVA